MDNEILLELLKQRGELNKRIADNSSAEYFNGSYEHTLRKMVEENDKLIKHFSNEIKSN